MARSVPMLHSARGSGTEVTSGAAPAGAVAGWLIPTSTAAPNSSPSWPTSAKTAPVNNTSATLATMEESIRQIMEQQVSRLSAALEARVDMKSVDALRRITEVEGNWKLERQERENSMMALQRDMLTLTDSAVKERELIERIFQDLEALRSGHSQAAGDSETSRMSDANGHEDSEARFKSFCGRADGALADIAAQREELASMIEKSVAELCAALALQQQEEMSRLQRQICEEHRQMLDSFSAKLPQVEQQGKLLEEQGRLLEKLQGQVVELSSSMQQKPSDLKQMRSDLPELSMLSNLRQLQQQAHDQFAEIELERIERARNNQEVQTALQTMMNDIDLFKAQCTGCSEDSERHQSSSHPWEKRVQRTEELVNEISSSTFAGLEAMRAEISRVREVECNKVGELCSQALAGWEEGQAENIVNMEQRLDAFRNALTSHLSEVQSLAKETANDLRAEREDRRESLADVRASLAASLNQSVRRIELLETDLIDMTRALKRLDQKVRDVARGAKAHPVANQSSLRQISPAARAVAKSRDTSSTGQTDDSERLVVCGMEELDSAGPCKHGPLGSLLEAAGPLAAEVPEHDRVGSRSGNEATSSEASVESAQQLRVELIKRAAGSNPGLSSILRRARELGEV